jgi:hypothetical protein
MTNWEAYVKESFDIVRRAECELTVNLNENLEAYLVHLFAYYMDKPKVNTVPIAVKMLGSVNLPIEAKKQALKSVGDECLLINSMEWGKRRWPSDNYYADMGQMAYITRAYAVRPPENLYDDLAIQFQTATKILRKCRTA